VDTPEKPKPRRSRKRQLAGVVLVLLIAYPFSSGPFSYAVGRGWASHLVTPAEVFYAPAGFVLRLIPGKNGGSLAQDWHRWNYECTVGGIRDAQRG
jgi:hypothetical protein